MINQIAVAHSSGMHNQFVIAATILNWFLAVIWRKSGKNAAEMLINLTLKFGFIALALWGSWILVLQHLAQ
jgi:uncharacterized membrane protein YphA (DoxX/SURF4 family)